MKVLIAMVIGLFGFVATSLHASLIQNGSFEEGAFDPSGSGWSWNSIPAGGTVVDHWVAIESGFDWHRAVEFMPAYDGDKMVDLTYGSDFGGIAQTFPTLNGQQYVLTFALAAPNQGLQDPREVHVDVAGGSYTFWKTASVPGSLTWDVETLLFTATSDTTTLTFRGNGADGYRDYWGPVIDAVSVEAVPDAGGTFALLGFGLTGLAGLRRRLVS
jgi:choice-of-anchor C domain-containing protein